MSFVLDGPGKVLGFATSSTVAIVVCIALYIVWTSGYPRPFWTHHTLQPQQQCVSTVSRMLRRIKSIKENFMKDTTCPVLDALEARAPGRLRELVQRYDDAMVAGETETIYACVNILLDGNGDDRTVQGLLAAVERVAGSVSTVSDVLLDVRGGTTSGKCVACAIADLKLIVNQTLPAITKVHGIQTRQMNFIQTITFHVAFEFTDYRNRVRDAFTLTKEEKVRATYMGVKVVVIILAWAHDMMGQKPRIIDIDANGNVIYEVVDKGPTNEKRNNFGTGIRTNFDWMKKAKYAFPGYWLQLGGKLLFRDIWKGVRNLLPQWGKDMIAVFKGILDALRMLVSGIRMIVAHIRVYGFVSGIGFLIRMLIGFVVKVAVTIMQPVWKRLFALIYLYVAPAITTIFYTLLLVIMVAIRLVIGIADFMLAGRLRFLQYVHESPDAWWDRAGYERGNMYKRFIVCWLPCSKGYLPALGGMTCACDDTGLPRFSPASLLVRQYLLGSFRDWGRKVPARTSEVLKRYRNLCVREYASVLSSKGTGRFARDLVECLILSKDALFKSLPDIDELVTYAALTTRSAGGRIVANPSDTPSSDHKIDVMAAPWWPYMIMLSSVAVAAIVIYKRRAMLYV